MQAYELHQFIIMKSTIHGRIPLFPRQITRLLEEHEKIIVSVLSDTSHGDRARRRERAGTRRRSKRSLELKLSLVENLPKTVLIAALIGFFQP